MEQFDFNSRNDGAPDGFAGYHQLYSYGTDVDHAAGPFRASVTVHRFRQMLVFERELSGMSHTRGLSRVRRSGFDHINLQLLLSGNLVGGGLDNQVTVRPGEIIVFDMTQPQRTALREAQMIALSLPRNLVERHLPRPLPLHGTVLTPQSGGLLAEFMHSLVRQSGMVAPHATDHAGTVVGALLASALGGLDSPAQRLPGHYAVRHRFDRITQHMAAFLQDPGLSAAGTAAALGLSRSTLDRAMAEAGGFAALLLQMRLDRLRAALRQTDTTLPVGAIAHGLGFRSLSHCSRTFSDRFGLPPQRWREARWMERRGTGTLEPFFQELR